MHDQREPKAPRSTQQSIVCVYARSLSGVTLERIKWQVHMRTHSLMVDLKSTKHARLCEPWLKVFRQGPEKSRTIYILLNW